MNRVLFLEVSESWQKDYLAADLKDKAEVEFSGEPFDASRQGNDRITILSPFVNSRIHKADFERLPSLKFIPTRSTGFDHVDIQAAKSKGVPVSNVPSYGENTVAEHTFALILSLSRNLRKAYFKTRDNDFSLDGLMGFDLKEKVIGVVGTGHIGLHVIQMARGFGLRVLAFDVKKNQFLSEVLGFQYVALDELLAQSDIITLHVPAMPATHHLLNETNIGKIKRGAILINTSRGSLVETSALVKALDDGILSGAGLDVLEGEEWLIDESRLLDHADQTESLKVTLKNHILLHRDNVVYTPHIAFYSKEAVTRILATTVQNIRSFLAGSPENVVNR